MIQIKTKEEIEVIKEAGRILARVKEVIKEKIVPGVTFAQLDSLAEGEILKLGAEPGFKRVYDYKWTTCINVGDGVVHGIPGDYSVGPGDKISVDVGAFYKGFYTDSAFTVGVPPVSIATKKFIEAGQRALGDAIGVARPGKRIGHISQAMERVLIEEGFSPVVMFTGHGVGRNLHEEPSIPCFLRGNILETPKILSGMVLAIESIYTEGSPDIKISRDGWTAQTRDGRMGGLFEETVVVTDQGTLVVTR